MPEQLFANVASTTLNGAITNTATSFTVTSSANFPTASTTLDREFRAAFVDGAVPPNVLEYFSVGNVSGTTWSDVTRAVEDPTRFPAAARSSGVRIVMLVTRGVLESFERRSRTVGHNVLDYGAVGNGSVTTSGVGNDDTAAIQSAYDDSRSASGQAIVIYPGRKTYRITNTITVTTGGQAAVQTVGLGSMRGDGIVNLPSVAWDGAEDAVMYSVGTTGTNIPGALFRNINIRGLGVVQDSMVGLPSTAIRLWREDAGVSKIDSASGLDEVWFARTKGDAVRVECGGLTNWWIRGGRWDQINGYALYIAIKSQSHFSVRDLTWDNWGANFPGHGKGFMHLDCTGGGATAYALCHLDTVHLEANSDLIETLPTGATNADKRGYVALSIDPTQGNINHQIVADAVQLMAPTAALSRSFIQMLGGTEAERSSRLMLHGRMIRGFGGDGTAATGQCIPIGGITAGDKTTYTSGHYMELVHGLGGGSVFGSEIPRVWRKLSAP